MTWKSIEYLSNFLIKQKENIEGRKRHKENEKRITYIDTNRFVVEVV